MKTYENFLLKNNFNIFIKDIERDCKFYLSMLKGKNKDKLLLRATYEFSDPLKKFDMLKDRKPLDTPIDIHNILNSYFKKKFGWNVRNGVFAYITNEIVDVMEYGEPYIFLPIGNFEYVYSDKIVDLTRHISNNLDVDIVSYLIKNRINGDYREYYLNKIEQNQIELSWENFEQEIKNLETHLIKILDKLNFQNTNLNKMFEHNSNECEISINAKNGYYMLSTVYYNEFIRYLNR